MPANNDQAFARRVLDAFAAAGRVTDAQVIAAGGPSTSTMTKLRKVADGYETMPEPREPTWSKIDRAASWHTGSARRVWRGYEPNPANDGPDDALDAVVDILPAFDALPGRTRKRMVDLAWSIANQEGDPVRADRVMRDLEGAEMAVGVTREWDGLDAEAVEVVIDAATDLLWEHPRASAVAVQVFSADDEVGGYVLVERAELEVRHRGNTARLPGAGKTSSYLAEAARDVGRPGSTEKARADQDAATSGSQERPGTDEGA